MTFMQLTSFCFVVSLLLASAIPSFSVASVVLPAAAGRQLTVAVDDRCYGLRISTLLYSFEKLLQKRNEILKACPSLIWEQIMYCTFRHMAREGI